MYKTLNVIYLGAILVALGCSRTKSNSNYWALVPTSEHCAYTMQNTNIPTLTNANELSGDLGQVVFPKLKLTDSNADAFLENLGTLSTRYSTKDNGLFPMNQATLAGVSIYANLQKTLLTVQNFSSALGVTTRSLSLTQAKLIYQFQVLDASNTVLQFDNAEYLALPSSENSASYYDLFLLYRAGSDDSKLPVYFNTGIIAHEFTHLLLQRLVFDNPNFQQAMPLLKQAELASLNEGFADYVGFLVSQDPNFIACSFDDTQRNLSIAKQFVAPVANSSPQDSFDPHDGGAIWASILYQVGLIVGHDTMARAVLDSFTQTSDCLAASQNETSLISTVVNCVTKNINSPRKAEALQYFQSALGVYR